MANEYTVKGDFRTVRDIKAALDSIASDQPNAEVKVVTSFTGWVREIKIRIEE